MERTRTLSDERAQQAVNVVYARFNDVTIEDVREVFKHGSVTEGVVSADYDEAKSEAILETLDALGVEVL